MVSHTTEVWKKIELFVWANRYSSLDGLAASGRLEKFKRKKIKLPNKTFACGRNSH